MTRLATILTTVLLALGMGGCDKPSSEDCEKALRNIQQIVGTDTFSDAATIQGEIRRCRGASSKTAVACAIKATTMADLDHCDLAKPRKRDGTASPGSATGSGEGSAGSAGPASPK